LAFHIGVLSASATIVISFDTDASATVPTAPLTLDDARVRNAHGSACVDTIVKGLNVLVLY
jgi:hypothetical protein